MSEAEMIERLNKELKKDEACMVDAIRLLKNATGDDKAAKRLLLQRLLEKENSEISNEKRYQYNKGDDGSAYKGGKSHNPRVSADNETAGISLEMEYILKFIGKTGLSIMKDIRNELARTMSDSKAWRNLKKLQEFGYIDEMSITAAGARHFSLCCLTQAGEATYTLLTGKSPEEPEMEKLRNAYTTYERGYSVKAFKNLFEEAGAFSAVSTCNEPIHVDEKGRSYAPDIRCEVMDKDEKESVSYYDYVSSKEGESACYGKLDNLYEVTDEIHILVSCACELENIKSIILEWAFRKKHMPGFTQKRIRVTDYTRIKQCLKNGLQFNDWWSTDTMLKNMVYGYKSKT